MSSKALRRRAKGVPPVNDTPEERKQRSESLVMQSSQVHATPLLPRDDLVHDHLLVCGRSPKIDACGLQTLMPHQIG